MKFVLISIIFHVLIINFIWVGFSVSTVKKNSVFVYLGETIAPNQADQENSVEKKQNEALHLNHVVDDSATFFVPWLKMRQVNKPR